MKAQLIYRWQDVTPEGHIIEIVVWLVPSSVEPCQHEYKYSLVYVVEGRRVVGFDNERGKGDHCHLDGIEQPYTFVSIDKLIEDFLQEVAKRRL
jgi:hypothetical protein